MCENPLISILVPCCNVEKYVAKCLTSIVNQTYRNLEIICINDGSNDGTLDIIRGFAAKDERIVVIDKPNSGYGDSMNVGLSLCRGKYIGIVESDDWVDADMFAVLLDAAEENELDIARCCYYENRDGHETAIHNEWVLKNKVYCPMENQGPFAQAPAIWVNLCLKEMIVRHGIKFLPTPGASFQDTSFAFKLYASAERFMMLDRPMLHYRINAGSSVVNPKKVMCVCEEWKEIYRFAKSLGEDAKRLLWSLPFLQHGTYWWNYSRIEGVAKYQFLKAWHVELLGHIKDGDINWLEMDDSLRSRLHRIAFDFEAFHAECVGKSVPTISIIISTYNCEKYVENTLRSVITQTYRDIEIICVDDCSTDSTAIIVERVSREDDRVKFIRHERNKGVSATRNTALSVATGTWLMFIDGDDLLPEKAAEFLLSLTNDNVDMVWSSIHVEYEGSKASYGCVADNDEKYYAVPYNGERKVTYQDRIYLHQSCSAKLYRRSVVVENELSFPEGLCFEDACWNFCYLSVCRTNVAFSSKPTYTYIRHVAGSIMTQLASGRKAGLAIQHLYIIDYYYKFLLKRGRQKENAEFLAKLYLPYFWLAMRFCLPYERVQVVWTLADMLGRHHVDVSNDQLLTRIANGDVGELLLHGEDACAAQPERDVQERGGLFRALNKLRYIKFLLPYGFMVHWLSRKYGLEIDKPLFYYAGVGKKLKRVVKFALPYGVIIKVCRHQ